MAETSGLLNRRTGYSRTEGSNPSVSASLRPSGSAWEARHFKGLAIDSFYMLIDKRRVADWVGLHPPREGP